MAKKQQKIKVISQVYVGDKLTLVSDLNAEQKERLGIALLVTYNNALFAGKAVFSPPPGYELGTDENGRVTCKRVPIEIAQRVTTLQRRKNNGEKQTYALRVDGQHSAAGAYPAIP